VVVASMARHRGGVVRVLPLRHRGDLVFSKVFFSASTSELDAILARSSPMPSASPARPLGGIVFGHYGDKYGRKKLLQFSCCWWARPRS